jgi:hypothetical protein
MGSAEMALAWGDVPAWVQTAVVVAAAVVAAIQLRRADDSRKIDRVLEIHHQMTTGDVGAARDQLSPIIRNGAACRMLQLGDFDRVQVEGGRAATSCLVVILRAFERAWESYDHGRPIARWPVGC